MEKFKMIGYILCKNGWVYNGIKICKNKYYKTRNTISIYRNINDLVEKHFFEIDKKSKIMEINEFYDINNRLTTFKVIKEIDYFDANDNKLRKFLKIIKGKKINSLKEMNLLNIKDSPIIMLAIAKSYNNGILKDFFKDKHYELNPIITNILINKHYFNNFNYFDFRKGYENVIYFLNLNRIEELLTTQKLSPEYKMEIAKLGVDKFLDFLVKDEDANVRKAVAEQGRPCDLLRLIDDEEVIPTLIESENDIILEKLANYKNKRIANIAKTTREYLSKDFKN
jgi:hypothetical protein